MHFNTVELDLLAEEVWREVKRAFKYPQIKTVGGGAAGCGVANLAVL